MITLDYYDDNTVRDNAVFFTFKRIFAIVIASYLSASFSTYKLCKIKIIVLGICLIELVVIFALLNKKKTMHVATFIAISFGIVGLIRTFIMENL